MIDHELTEYAKNIRLLALDCDGVLTDGGVYIFEDGREFRRFDIKDGLGLKHLIETGIAVAVISASGSQSVLHRASQLGILEVHLNCADKLSLLDTICQRMGISLRQVVYVGDDITDLEVMLTVGFAWAPSNAASEVRDLAHFVSRYPGGFGAVREVCDWISSHVRDKPIQS